MQDCYARSEDAARPEIVHGDSVRQNTRYDEQGVINMKMKKLTAMLTAVLCSASTLAAFPAMNTAAVEAVGNDFEVNYEGWYAKGDTASIEAVEGAGYAGSRGMIVSNRASAQDGAASSKGFYMVGGVAYTYHVQVKSDTDQVFRVSVLTKDEDTDAVTEQEILTKNVRGGKWTDLSAVYEAPENSYEFCISITTDSTDDFTFDEVHITSKKPVDIVSAAANETGLKDAFANYFRVGNILNGGTVKNSAITGTFLKDYNAIECENETKPDATMVQNGSTDNNIKVSLNNCAAICDFAVKNNLAFRGHTLVWHSQMPQWFFKQGFNANGAWVDKTTMNTRMESYIKNMFAAYQKQYPTLNLYAYDVCNECVSDDSGRTASAGGARTPGWGNGASPWVQIYGSNEFVEKAFTYAKQYAPKTCKLYYNDYNEYWDHKRDCIYNMCKSLYQKGLLDGVGMQSHINADRNGFSGTSAYVTAMKKYLSIGCDVQITELDISRENNKYSDTDQANKYTDIFKAAMDWNKNPQGTGRVTLVQIWGPNDANTWIKTENAPLLYNTNNQPKAAYTALMNLVPKSDYGDYKNPANSGGTPTPFKEPELDSDGYWFNIDFEDGNGGFSGRGAATAEVSSTDHYSGSKALFVSGRTAEWNGAGMDLDYRTFKAGETYSFSANVKYTDGEATDSFYLSLQYTNADGKTEYAHIAEGTAAKNEWVQISNTTFTLPEGGSDYNLYIEMPNSTSDFYVDGVISSVAGRSLPGAGESTAQPVQPTKPARTSALRGDVDGDGVIDTFDLALAKRGLIKGFSNKYDEQSADITGNGKVEVEDIVLLNKYVHKLITEFPEPETPPTPPAPEYDHSKWDNYQETASPQYIDFYKSSIKNMGNTSRLTAKLAAAEKGEPLKVAYLGGSITEGKNYTTPFSNYLKNTFAKGGFTEINAGMSGTSSVVGLVRSEKQIVSQSPDIIFIEFSVNDHEDILYKKSFESVIQKFLELPNEPAVGIIINRSKGGFSTQAQMYPIGKNFDIPVISMDDALTKAFNSGFLQAGDYFTDEYHPHQKGGQLVADCMAYYVRQALKTENITPAYQFPAAPVNGNEYKTCVNVDPKNLDNFNAGSWTAGNGYGNGALPYSYTLNGGSPMTFKTKAKGFIVVFKANSQGMGSIDVTVNGKTTKINGNKRYTWGGPDAELGYYQNTEGDLNVSISGSGQFTIWGIGLIQ